MWWCHSWIHHGFLSTPKIPLRSPGLEAEHVTLCWGVFINIYMFLFTFTVIEKGSCTTWRAQEEAEGRRRGRKKRYGLEGGTFQRSQGAPKEGRNVCIYSERQPWDEGGIEEGEEKERVRGWGGDGGRVGGCVSMVGGDGNPRHVFTVLAVQVPGTICFRKHTSRRTELARFSIAG